MIRFSLSYNMLFFIEHRAGDELQGNCLDSDVRWSMLRHTRKEMVLSLSFSARPAVR
jgi:hypothetical protein